MFEVKYEHISTINIVTQIIQCVKRKKNGTNYE